MQDEDILEKYEIDVLKNLDKDNLIKIITFLETKNCCFISELLCDYLDLFTFSYEEFVRKYNYLDRIHKGNLLDDISDDMNILEEFYTN